MMLETMYLVICKSHAYLKHQASPDSYARHCICNTSNFYLAGLRYICMYLDAKCINTSSVQSCGLHSDVKS
jgi:hypothetical protein